MNDPALLRVLRCFLTRDTVGFTELALLLDFETDLTGYYLRKLQDKMLVEKIERGLYSITPEGKSLLARDSKPSMTGTAPRVAIMVLASKGNSYATLERIRQPFVGRVEWPVMSLEAGVSLTDMAKEVAVKRLGVNAQPQFTGFFRRTDTHGGKVFDDKFFAVHTLDLTESHELVEENEVGMIRLLTQEQINELTNASRALKDILEFSRESSMLSEKSYALTREDLYLR